MEELLSINDPDWAAFGSSDPEYLLRVCGDAIRKYCGWHIFPNVTETVTKLRIGSNGRVMLPSLYVTDVLDVTLQTGIDNSVLLTPDQYVWLQEGVVQPAGLFWWSGSYSAYYYGPDSPAYVPWMNYGYAAVTFAHGYDAVPEDIKQVAYEMAAASGGTGGGQIPSNANVKEVSSPGFRLMLGGAVDSLSGTGTAGSLTNSQKNRLASYRIGVVA